VPPEGIKKLPNNFFVNRIVEEVAIKEKVEGDEEVLCDLCDKNDRALVLCVDCMGFLCNYCHEYHKRNRDFQSHNTMQLEELKSKKETIKIRKRSKLLCQDHDLELNFYCETCERLVCHYCTTTDHSEHAHNTVRKMASKHRAELDRIMEPIGKMIDSLSKAHRNITAAQEKLQTQAAEVDRQIDDYYEQLQQRLRQQKEELKEELHEISKQKKKAVSVQMEQMEYTQAQLESIKELNNAVKNGSDHEALFMKKQVIQDVKRLTDCYNNLNTEPTDLGTMEFVPVKEYKDCYPQFAHVLYSKPDPENTEVIVPRWSLPGKVKIKILAKDHNNSRSKGGNQLLVEAQLSTGDAIPIELEDNKDGSYVANFVPSHREVKVSITIEGKHIKGSPFTYPPLIVPSKVVNDGGKMGKPWGITFSKDGMWAASDHTNHCVYIFDGQDQLVRKFGTKGKGNGQFDSPTGLAFDAENNLYVVCRYNHRVQKLTIDGKYLLKFGSMGTGNGQLDCPLCITVHIDKVYVADQCNHRISVFKCDGNFCHTIGSGQLNCPFDVAVNSNNQLLVANYYGNCISIFTLDGNYIGKVGMQGSSRGQLSTPSSLAINVYGFIIITERDNCRASIFDKDGVFVHCFGSKGSAIGKFSAPCGVALSPNGNIYISDRDNQRIQIVTDH